MSRPASEIAAMKWLDDFMAAFNARDVKAFEATFNFPSVRFASGALAIIEPGYHKSEMFERGAVAQWDRSAWDRCDGSLIGGFDLIYVVTRENNHWGVPLQHRAVASTVSMRPSSGVRRIGGPLPLPPPAEGVRGRPSKA
jgi:hypothetical protein